MKNIFFENLNCLIIKDFWKVKIWQYFHKPIWVASLVVFQFLYPKTIFFESFRWGIILLDFMGFLFKTFKLKNDISYIEYKYSLRFGKVYRWLNMYYSKIRKKIFKKIITMSIWII